MCISVTHVNTLISLQVIPTVGVEGENADRNRRAMLKHFSRLVDSSARKAKFLSAFQKRPHSCTLDDQPGAQDDGIMTSVTEKDVQLGNVKEDMLQGTDSIAGKPGVENKARPFDLKSGGLQQETSSCMNDSNKDIVKLEDRGAADLSTGFKQENGKVFQHASLQPEHIKAADVPESGNAGDSEAKISSCEESMKAEELRATEDGVAMCVEQGKVPSECLSAPVEHPGACATARHEPWVSCLCPDCQVRHVLRLDTIHVFPKSPQRACALSCAAGCEAGEEGVPGMEEAVQQLMSILDTGASTLEARQLLFRANGDIARALNLHYDDASKSGTMLPAKSV